MCDGTSNIWRYCPVTYIIKCQICLTQFNRTAPNTPNTPNFATRRRLRTLRLSGGGRGLVTGDQDDNNIAEWVCDNVDMADVAGKTAIPGFSYPLQLPGKRSTSADASDTVQSAP